MLLDADQCYKALVAHDTRFDGRFFVGVGSTGIYCRPVCTARTPKRTSCSFFSSAAAAESGGFRPCLRCRPELAPGNSAVDANARLAQSVAGLIEDGRLEDDSVAGLAGKLKVTDRHLRRVFQQEYGVSPIEFAQTQRLLLAKRLLTDTQLSVTDTAFASGFASVRRFNDLFSTRYRLTPSELRKSRLASGVGDRLRFELGYRPPYDWTALLAFLEKRSVAGVESVSGKRYRRSIRLSHNGKVFAGWLEAQPATKKHALRIDVSASLAPCIPPLLARVKRAFDLNADPAEIAAALGELAKPNPGLRLPGSFDGFELGVRAILGQQITVKAATTIAGRFAAAFGEPIETPLEGVTHLFPSPDRIAALEYGDIAKLGIVSARARALIAMAQAIDGGELDLGTGADIESTLAALEALPGIGAWTAQYIAMRALSWPDAFPHPDVALLKAMDMKPAAALKHTERWRPWRAYAVMHLWKSLEKKP
jgi:AraC family transcriptional regulator of adaptative response / DNA-3-methyladenine glycosylase II